MEIIEIGFNALPLENKDIVLCLGFFDGIHLGHQFLFNEAKKEGYPVAAFTFDNSPAYVLGKKMENSALTSVSDRAEYFEEMGIDYMYIFHFDLEASKYTKDQFIDLILKPINPKKIYCGKDFRFGAREDGIPEYLKLYFDVEIIPIQSIGNEKIAARKILSSIQEGNVKYANKLLGKPYRICGLVVKGKHNGTRINFPTANLELSFPYAYPKIGVYMGYADLYGDKYKVLICVSTHPTVDRLDFPIIEVHVLDYEGDLYGQEILVEFIDYVRDVITFESIDDLKAQIEKDKEFVKNKLQ